MGGSYTPTSTAETLALLAAFISSVNIAGKTPVVLRPESVEDKNRPGYSVFGSKTRPRFYISEKILNYYFLLLSCYYSVVWDLIGSLKVPWKV